MTKLWLLVAVIASACASVNQNASTDTQTSSTLQQGALPAGGSDVIGPNTFTALQGGSSPEVKLDLITVTGQAFTNAWRVTGLKPLPQPYYSQLSANNTIAIKKDDLMLAQF